MTSGVRRLLMISPAFLVLILFFAMPLGYLLVVSFWRLRSYKLVPDLIVDNYVLVYTDYLRALLFTLFISAVVATITTVFGFLAAYFVRFRGGRYGPVLLFVTLITLFGGYLVKIYAWKTILGTQGILNTAMIQLGLIQEPITWLLYSPVAVIVTLVHFLLPFAILPIYGALRGIADTPLEAARDLGATPLRIVLDVILPACEPGLFAAFALSFLLTAGDYVTPRLVGGTETFMLGNFIESQFINRLNAPVGSALSFSLLLTCGILLLLARRLAARLLKKDWSA